MAEASPPTQTPPSETCTLSSPKYNHDETATIQLHPSADETPWSLHARVHLESTTTLTSPSPLFHYDKFDVTGTPFSEDLLRLITRHKLHRLLIRVGDRASSNASFDEEIPNRHRFMGASGTSVQASFLTNNSHKIITENIERDEFKIRYTTLLRYLLNNNFFPPCGAPLDSLRERKHGHSIVVSPTNVSNSQMVEVASVLAADASTFCLPEFILSKNGWGAANGPCHVSDNWGLFDSLFGRPVDTSAKYKSSLSELLLGSSADAFGDNSDDDGRHSLWVELQASPNCFSNASIKGLCTIEVTRGVSYRIALPPPTSSGGNETESTDFSLAVTLGDILLGRNTLARSVALEGWKAWYPCPLSDSSRVVLLLPNGYEASMAGGDKRRGEIEINALKWKNGYLDLAEPWTEIFQSNDVEATVKPGTFGISRTAQRPMGIAGRGTLVTVVRYSEDMPAPSNMVRVESFDFIPGHLIRPKLHTLRLVLYQGGGAGDVNFVPVGGYDYDSCASDTRFPQCGVTNRTTLSLSDLHGHSLTRLSDGTILVERTVYLASDSSLWIAVDYDEAYLPFQKFPADANRGVDVFPSHATFTPITASAPQQSTTLYSPSLLLLPPVPDMSMPFNVISLSCTLWAFILGSLINILVRRSTESVKRELTGEKEKRPIDKIKDRLCEKGAKLRIMLKKFSGGFAKRKNNEEKENEHTATCNGPPIAQEEEEKKKDN